MKILIPDYYTKEEIEKIEAISPKIQIVKLTIKRNNLACRGIRWVSRNYLPYELYERVEYLLNRYCCQKKFLVDGKNPDGAFPKIEAFLCTAVITQDIIRKLLPLLPDMKWIHSTVTGVEHLLSHELIKEGKIVTSSIGIHKNRIAEFVLALILMMAKRLPAHFTLQRKKHWQILYSDEIEGKTLGIVGLGNIGQEVAKRARPLGMKVIATKRTPIPIQGITLLPPGKLADLLKQSDYVVIAAPLTKETFRMIGEREFRLMKKRAYLINVSRGDIIHQNALIHALKDGWIAGACFDVFHHMPLPKNSLLYSLPNLIITHHSAFASSTSNQEVFNLFLANVRRFINSERLLNVVDNERGY